MSEQRTTLAGRIRQTRFGEMLRLYRTVKGYTLRELGAQMGIGHATLMRIEHGEAFDVATLLKLLSWMLSEDKP